MNFGMKTLMSSLATITGRDIAHVALGVIALFIAYALGVSIAENLYPESMHNRIESIAGKFGASVGVLAVSVVFMRFLFRSPMLALVCLLTTEAFASAIIFRFTGPDIVYTFGWLYRITWNIVIAFLMGTAVGYLWKLLSLSISSKQPKSGHLASKEAP
jgi:multisubunit Na+/H+ antiporter MnhG subunit